MLSFDIMPDNDVNKASIELVYSIQNTMEPTTVWNQELVRDIQCAWSDSGIQATFRRRFQFTPYNLIDDSAQYFFDELERIGAVDFSPNNKDVLMCRKKTTGIVEDYLDMKGVRVHFVDVGGQRNERKKWMNQFQCVTTVMYVYFVLFFKFCKICSVLV
jgi:guanine nucleotide-binding protein G(i) subunit alpha